MSTAARSFYIENRTPIPGATPVTLDVVRRLLARLPADRPTDACWHFATPLTGPASNYANLPFKTSDGSKVAIQVHRLSYLWFVGPIPDNAMILHRCNSKGCANPGHLYAGDDLANAADRVAWEKAEAAAGRVTRGAAWRARLTAFAAERRAGLMCEAA